MLRCSVAAMQHHLEIGIRLRGKSAFWIASIAVRCSSLRSFNQLTLGAPMKKTLLAGVAAVALLAAAPAIAADLGPRMPVKAPPVAAPVPYFSWTGCYLGAHLGWGWGKKDTANISSGSFTSFLSGSTKTSGP